MKMKEIIDVSTGEVKVGINKALLRSMAIGSCIVIAAYDSNNKIGAMAHVMLPGSAPEKTLEKTKYAAEAINEMVNKMIDAGSNYCGIEVYLVGGGNVLRKKNDTICKENIESATKLLAEKNIPIRASVLGGITRKGIFFDVESGIVTYTEGNEKEKLLWKPKKRRG